MADWSKLSIDISSLIHGELSVLDYIRVGAVCKQWNFACKLKYHCPTKKPQSPWLVLPGECDTTTIKFFSILEKKTYKIPCPEPMIHRRVYIGSGHGWLVTVDDICNMHLLNPLTGAQIPLPPVTTLPFVSARHNSHGQIIEFVVEVPYGANIISTLVFSFERMRCIFFQKAVLSAAPDVDDNCLIMMICNNWKHLVVGRARGEAWKCISLYHHYTNIIHRNGKFHSISDTGIVEVWEHDGSILRPRIIGSKIRYFLNQFMHYLVESLDGNLLLIVRAQEDIKPSDNFLGFSLDEKEHKWKKVSDLHEQTLFLGYNHSMCLSATNFPELQHNCIYSTNNKLMYYQHGSHDMEIFYLKEKKTQQIYQLERQLNWPPPIWLTPSLS
ncbi:unnamed protein product [Musa acuminata var. zebrina]